MRGWRTRVGEAEALGFGRDAAADWTLSVMLRNGGHLSRHEERCIAFLNRGGDATFLDVSLDGLAAFMKGCAEGMSGMVPIPKPGSMTPPDECRALGREIRGERDHRVSLVVVGGRVHPFIGSAQRKRDFEEMRPRMDLAGAAALVGGYAEAAGI